MDKMEVIKLDASSSALFNAGFLDKEEADKLLEHMINDIPWRQSQRSMYGKIINIPRLQCWMADPAIDADLYQKEPAVQWSPLVNIIKERIEKMLNCKFNYVLLNHYRDGQDSIAAHSDNEATDSAKNIIASLSVGATRNFTLKPKNARTKPLVENPKMKFALNHGSLIVMQGDTQKGWIHAIPKEPKVTEPRINLTFRIA
jgi:alkylated DNA repair dioxygenase AlkB